MARRSKSGSDSKAAPYADNALGTFKGGAISAPDAPGIDEVAEAFVQRR